MALRRGQWSRSLSSAMQSRGDGGVGPMMQCCAVGEEDGDGQMVEEGSTVVG